LKDKKKVASPLKSKFDADTEVMLDDWRTENAAGETDGYRLRLGIAPRKRN
jgi:hypothetical protein